MLVDSKREDSLRSKTSREAKEDETPKHFHFSVYFTPFASHRHQIKTEIQSRIQNKWQKKEKRKTSTKQTTKILVFFHTRKTKAPS